MSLRFPQPLHEQICQYAESWICELYEKSWIEHDSQARKWVESNCKFVVAQNMQSIMVNCIISGNYKLIMRELRRTSLEMEDYGMLAMFAARHGNLKFLKLLHSKFPKSVMQARGKLVEQAILFEQIHVLAWLRNFGFRVGYSSLELAGIHGKQRVINYMIAKDPETVKFFAPMLLRNAMYPQPNGDVVASYGFASTRIQNQQKTKI